MIGHIYRIIHLESDVQYVGSTFNELRKRWQMHKKDYNTWLGGDKSTISIYPFFNEHGIEKFKLILIKSYDVIDRKHLMMFEQLWINNLKSVNENSPFQIDRFYRQDYRIKNRDELNLKQKEYYNINKTTIKQRDKERYEANKEKINAKYQCECGGKYTHQHKASHAKSKKHQRWLENNQV
jgi:hypothetical protein